jgi:hypothetical protein
VDELQAVTFRVDLAIRPPIIHLKADEAAEPSRPRILLP